MKPAPALEARVMVVDGNPAYRVGLSSLLRAAGLDVVGEAHDVASSLEAATRHDPDVILLDRRLPGASGEEAIRLITASAPRSRVVVLTMTAEDPDVLDALTAGACGCILKNAPMHEVLAAIGAAAEGESVISPPIASKLVRQLRLNVGPIAIAPELSPRELEVLKLLAHGWDNARIAAALYVSRATIKHHISSILTKLEVDNRIQAAVRAVRAGLLDP